MKLPTNAFEGILLINKPKGKSSFSLVKRLRKSLQIKKVGFAGTLDPLATGLMVMLLGKKYTKLSEHLTNKDKEYLATMHLGYATTTYDREGTVTDFSNHIPTKEEIFTAVNSMQGKQEQTPPMFSAKKVQGKKLYQLARKGIEIQRKSALVDLNIEILHYHYPYLILNIACSKGTYIRSIAHDLGKKLQTYCYLFALQRTRCGNYHINHCLDGNLLFTASNQSLEPKIKQSLLRYESTY